MKPTVRAIMIASGLVAGIVATEPANTQDQGRVAQAGGGRIAVEYQPSRLPAVVAALQHEKALEELQDFLSPLRLPADLKITTADCGALKSPYRAGQPVRICYELISQIAEAAKKIYPQDASGQAVVIVGAFMQAALHEVAFAIFDLLQVPVWGRADDAADRLAALIMVELGEDVEKVAIYGTTALFKWSADSAKTWTGSSFADTASPDAQRYYNYLCIAVAADYPNFGGFIEKGTIPAARAADCLHEYEQVRAAFDLRIMPFVDPDALVRVRATQWLGWAPPK
jgi:hypothetical protein